MISVTICHFLVHKHAAYLSLKSASYGSMCMNGLSNPLFSCLILACVNYFFFFWNYKPLQLSSGIFQQLKFHMFMSFPLNCHMNIHHFITIIISSSESSSMPEYILLTSFFIQNRVCWPIVTLTCFDQGLPLLKWKFIVELHYLCGSESWVYWLLICICLVVLNASFNI